MAETVFNLIIISQEGVLFSGKASQVLIPTTTGPIEILPNHENILSQIDLQKDGVPILIDGKNWEPSTPFTHTQKGYVVFADNNCKVVFV